MRQTITVAAPGKINLTLSILGRLTNGFHLLSSLLSPISLQDEVTISLGCNDHSAKVVLSEALESHFQSCEPCAETRKNFLLHLNSSENLAFRAAQAFIKQRGLPERGFSIEIKKHLPFGAGLGGGSSDAAATLLGLNTLHNYHCTQEELRKIAASLGSDIAALLEQRLVHMCARGELITRLDERARAMMSELLNHTKLVLLKPSTEVSTQVAYESLSLPRKIQAANAEEFTWLETKKDTRLQGLGLTLAGAMRGDKWLTLLPQEGIRLTLDSGSLETISQNFLNDFQELIAAKFPEVGEACSLMKQVGAFHVLLCGSGSSVAGFFANAKDRDEAVSSLSKRAPTGWFIASTELCPDGM